jgi:tetratricopeptide (TPR) repeat protein
VRKNRAGVAVDPAILVPHSAMLTSFQSPRGRGHWLLPVAVSLVIALAFVGTTAPACAQDDDPERIKWARQIAFLQGLLAREPSLPNHYMRLAQAYARLGMEQEVLRYAQESVSRGGSALAVDILVGDFYSDQERYDDAIARYLRVLDVAPQQAHVLTQVWLILQRDRQERLGLRIRVEDLASRMNNAGYYVSSGRPSGDRQSARARIAEGNRFLNGNDVRSAIQAYKRAADDDPWNADIYRGLGVAYARQSDFVRAIGAYHLYLALASPGTPDVPKVRQIIIDYYRRAR